MGNTSPFAFLEIFKKAKVDKRLGFHWNGPDNLYPNEIENLIAESVTAVRGSRLMSAYMIGKGFEGYNSIVVNEDENLTLFEFGNDIAQSIANHKGVWIHMNYNFELNIMDFKVLPFTDCRLGRKDSNKYSGKVLVCDDWADPKKVKNAQRIDVFNSNKDVIQAQIDAAEGIENYKGQIFYYNDGPYVYPLSPLHPSRDDAGSERQASTYKYTSLKKGFFGKTLVITAPLVESALKNAESTDDKTLYQDQLKDRKDFRETIQSFVGAENVDGVLHLELEFDEKIDDQIMFKNIDSNIDDKLFEFTENSVRNNIRMCFNNVPAVLIETPDGAMFGNSGEGIVQAKIFYQDQTVLERMQLTQIINMLMKYFKDPKDDFQITPLIAEPKVVEQKAQRFELKPMKDAN